MEIGVACADFIELFNVSPHHADIDVVIPGNELVSRKRTYQRSARNPIGKACFLQIESSSNIRRAFVLCGMCISPSVSGNREKIPFLVSVGLSLGYAFVNKASILSLLRIAWVYRSLLIESYLLFKFPLMLQSVCSMRANRRSCQDRISCS